ncbi:DUF159 family protein [Alteromonas sediminis]|uniref:Abasic site processing protein n=1 Tax=Alteromonas sediminis TaxID=2259342 RepID=A0A3N5ZAD6_9ALTE|nr:SOS response-associated peptidase family protein [Alteromonas sediminis]RPJ68044.1 DUF159 family protein [Alteromonas sediminis]
MCGRLNVVDNPALIELIEGLGIALGPSQLRTGRFKRATDRISIIRNKDGTRRLDDAIWWLLLEPAEQGFKPSKYTSFNTRYDKLNKPGSAGFTAFRQSRCVIPVMGFGESEFINKKPVHYHDFIAEQGALLMGGIYREWMNKATGEITLSCSVITVPPHPKLRPYHAKSSPLIMPQDSALLNAWLNENEHNTAQFEVLLEPHIPNNLRVFQIDKPSLHNVIKDKELVAADPSCSAD